MTRAQRKATANKEIARRLRNGTLQPGARERFPVLRELLLDSRLILRPETTTVHTFEARRKVRTEEEDARGRVIGHTTIQRKKVQVHSATYGAPRFRNALERDPKDPRKWIHV